MAATRYCPRCLHSFPVDPDRCPNLACDSTRPDGGWGRLHAAGDLLDRTYRVRERIAVGGAGITYRARELGDDDNETGPELAIKVLFQNAEGTILRRLSNEARVLQELEHPHIVACRGFVHRAGKPAYLVMEYEAGGNLYDHVRHVGALPLHVATDIASQMLEALCVAHRREVIHRDLKPQNILLRNATPREQVPHVLLADFGIAKVSGFVGDNLTIAGSFLGTPEFAAPEQFKGLSPAGYTDVYAAAAVFWYCLTGGPPIQFRNRTDSVECLRTLREELPPTLPDSLSGPGRARLEKLFAHTLCFEPEQRWSIAVFLESLAELDAPTETSTPLFQEPMGTMSPAALLDPPIEEKAVTPPPRRSTMESMFEVNTELPAEPAPPKRSLSLDDLFGGSSTPPQPEEPRGQAQEHLPPPPIVLIAWEPGEPQPMGNPATDAERLRALGCCAANERDALLDAFDDPALAIANAGADRTSRCGASLLARHHRIERHAPRALTQLRHADPDVRATAALAIGAIGRPAQLSQLNRLLADSEPRVRLAAVHALSALGEHTGKQSLVSNWLRRHSDSDDAVRLALSRFT